MKDSQHFLRKVTARANVAGAGYRVARETWLPFECWAQIGIRVSRSGGFVSFDRCGFWYPRSFFERCSMCAWGSNRLDAITEKRFCPRGTALDPADRQQP